MADNLNEADDRQMRQSSTSASVDVELEHVSKVYRGTTAVDDLSFSVNPGEFLTLLGPSGCGKSTTLNMIAGFVAPSDGRILLQGHDVVSLPPNKRDSAMVFQQYALFPHLKVIDNVAFGLKMRGVARQKRAKQALVALEMVGLADTAERFPGQLSGGQQQRVALARAIVLRPTVLLLDEPLSNLDLKLREQLRLEIRNLQREVGITTVFVTHDQGEALVMSDRILVMNKGKLQQIGTPEEIYHRPTRQFVGGFIGQSNLLPAELLETQADQAVCRIRDGSVFRCGYAGEPRRGDTGVILVRPEVVRVIEDAEKAVATSDVNVIRGVVHDVVYLGSSATVSLMSEASPDPVTIDLHDPSSMRMPAQGDAMALAAPAQESRFLTE